jgi:hypothetical protein
MSQRRKCLDDSAQVGGIMLLVGTIVLAGMIFIALGVLVDEVNHNLHQKQVNGEHVSQQTVDAVTVSINFFRATLFIIVLGIGIYLFKNSLRDSSGDAY